MFDGSALIVNEDVKQHFVNATLCKDEIFNVQQALWTKWKSKPKNLTEIDVNILGPLQDKYGHTSTGPYVHAMITAANAPQFVWANLDYKTAWDAYDEKFIRSDV